MAGKPLNQFHHSPHYPDYYYSDLHPYLDLSLVPPATAFPPVEFDPSFFATDHLDQSYYPDPTTTTTTTNNHLDLNFDFDFDINTLGDLADPVSDSAINSLLSSPDSLSESYLFESPSVQSLPDPQIQTPPPLSQPQQQPQQQMPAVTTDRPSTKPTFTVTRVATTTKEPPSKVSKRQLNTLAARRYRQRKLDRVNELEAELAAVKRERDELRMRVSKLEGETEALRGMVGKK
ncbi:hypothetical protein ASPACDRAFT_1852922 [Aspergillus aculeatus ATCC 16872]|uniref:BZIP domain-containing protein n=1 Tax=Aspergillus aculeatus (strain ATCC 16872 / CBS 172.66 / WB 5094) TaxID=690307 RepID=A0A1L9X6A5_ASPA1|nr:uncharacterized protein ASPACDRAFT_1852922 [Aspergillus aculeatus ATCC 16872]OJK04006.1 hypothetical protein ASPACDRAFT_1852922 [Aspergillus aculeatus ATCC 16872]